MTPQALLELWERGAGVHPTARGCALAAWGAGATVEEVAGRPLGALHALLLDVWRALTSAPIEAVADCPGCRQTCELRVDADMLAVRAPQTAREVVDDGGDAVVPRLPTTADVDAVAGLALRDARRELVRRAIGVSDASPRVQAAVATALEEADPGASCWLDLTCPSCGHAWQEPLELATFLWQEVEGRARSLLADVADLAAAFGWTERDVLALPPARRDAYLELAGS